MWVAWAASAVRCRSLCVQQTDLAFVYFSAFFTLRSATRFGFRRLFAVFRFAFDRHHSTKKYAYPFDLDSRFFVLSE
jgi:hypothetical protein